MVTFLPGDALKGICREAKDIIIAAPYIKAAALSRVLSDIDANASLVCITRWQMQDIALGASDIECRTIVKELGGAFKLHPALHAKYYRADERVLIGSANLTYSALGWSSDPNLEILCMAGKDFDAAAFERQLLDDSREISNKEFARWQSIERIDFQASLLAVSTSPYLDTWRPLTRAPENFLLAYRGLTDEIASTDEQQAALQDLDALQVPVDLTDEQVENWVSRCLLASQFVQTVLQMQNVDVIADAISLANTYSLNVTDARRSIETVQIWHRFLMSD
jgi:hypothetical protein